MEGPPKPPNRLPDTMSLSTLATGQTGEPEIFGVYMQMEDGKREFLSVASSNPRVDDVVDYWSARDQKGNRVTES